MQRHSRPGSNISVVLEYGPEIARVSEFSNGMLATEETEKYVNRFLTEAAVTLHNLPPAKSTNCVVAESDGIKDLKNVHAYSNSVFPKDTKCNTQNHH